MNIAVVGAGGREHAIIRKLKENQTIEKIYALPGNGGISFDAECVDIGAKDIPAIVKFAKENEIDFVVVTPDDPLVLGAVDALHEIGIPCFGPEKAAAAIEGSKVFAKDFMKKYNIPTASYAVFSDAAAALEYLKTAPYPTVIKADGLALGKGVVIAETFTQAEFAVQSIMEDKIFGESGSRIVIEEFLVGEEVSVLSFTDGKALVPMISSMDHKRAHDNDEGKNTGGMGTIAPNPFYTQSIAQECMETIFLPTIRGMAAEGRRFKGCLYFGLILTKDGPKVIEYNCRFGDPETQVVLPLLKTDLLTIMLAVESETLDKIRVEFSNDSACCVIIASGGYPESYKTGYEIHFNADKDSDAVIYHAGTKLVDGHLVNAGGRVLGVTATADTLENAIKKAYDNVKNVYFTDSFYRADIGKKALACAK
ncbi:MAG: phosphoribosylamine--glycine ligase [Oscillospiraceae bacterium]|nr:phosphoribosylamine--glycine ligase [Oscillospiraceae bacterium]